MTWKGFVRGWALGTAAGSALALGFAWAHPGTLPAYFIGLLIFAVLFGGFVFLKSR